MFLLNFKPPSFTAPTLFMPPSCQNEVTGNGWRAHFLLMSLLSAMPCYCFLLFVEKQRWKGITETLPRKSSTHPTKCQLDLIKKNLDSSLSGMWDYVKIKDKCVHYRQNSCNSSPPRISSQECAHTSVNSFPRSPTHFTHAVLDTLMHTSEWIQTSTSFAMGDETAHLASVSFTPNSPSQI